MDLAQTTPLISVDAVALDTETTGLDPRSARIVQIGAARIVGGALDRIEGLSLLVDPGEPIPAETTAIHGLDAASVAGAPTFPEAYDTFEAFRAGAMLVGHNLGFDMAVIRRECALAGRAFHAPSFLDTRLLGEFCFPGLAGYTLEILAARLKVEVDPAVRHDALGDARLAARLFLALAPHLKAKGVRTVGEADQACRGLSPALEGYAKAGWIEPRMRGEETDLAALGRIDAYPFRHRAGDVMGAPPATIGPDAPLVEAIAEMTRRRISSLFVTSDPDLSADATAIVTERDVLRAIAAGGAPALQGPVSRFASKPLATVPEQAFLYRALGRMDRLKLRHLGVVDEAGRVVGAISARDLLKVRASDALMLGDAVDAAGSVADLARALSQLPKIAGRLMDEGVPGLSIAAVISREIAAATRWAAGEAEKRVSASGLGPPPLPYAVIVLGSVGRGESLLAADQDNGLIHADPSSPTEAKAAEAWFGAFGAELAAALDDAGVPLCKGGVMAKNPAFRGSLSVWRGRIGEWITRNRPEDLLSVDIFFDFRCVAGRHDLAQTLFDDAYSAASRAPLLAKLLAAAIEDFRPPMTLFGNIRLDDGRVDLKKGGLFPIIAAARCLALRHGVRTRATPERVASVRSAKIGADADLEAFQRAHSTIVDALLKQQLADIAAGRAPGNLVDPTILTRVEQGRLKAALQALSPIGTTTRALLFQA